MKITFNDERTETFSENILQLLDEHKLIGKRGIAVAVNDLVIPSVRWEEVPVEENDVILVITAAAGG